MQGPESTPKAPLGNNSRPLQSLHYRTVRTNIDFAKVIQHCGRCVKNVNQSFGTISEIIVSILSVMRFRSGRIISLKIN